MSWSLRVLLLSMLLTYATACNPIDSQLPDTAAAPTDDAAPANSAGQPAEAAGEVRVAVADLAALREHVQKFRGKQVVVDIWSTSCAPCMHEFPNLVALSEKHAEQVACISFNVDYIGLKSKPPEDYVAKVEEFLQKQNATKITNLVSSTADEKVLADFEVESIPAILIFDTQGELAHKLTDANSGGDGLSYAGDVLPKLALVDNVTNK